MEVRWEDHKNPSQKIHIVHRRGRLNTDGKYYFNVSKSEAGRERERKKEKERERERDKEIDRKKERERERERKREGDKR